MCSYNDRWGNGREAQVSLSDFQEQVDAFKVSCAVHFALPDLRAGRLIQGGLRAVQSCVPDLRAMDAAALLIRRRSKSPSTSFRTS